MIMSNPVIHSLYIKSSINIEHYPDKTLRHPFDKGAQISIGDLHGNALKLIYFLKKHGVISNITEQTYHAFKNLYNKAPNKITAHDLAWFNQFIQDIEVNQGGTIRLLGDDLADRGKNDYFTLKILEKLFNHNIPVEIVLSNHSVDFIKNFEGGSNYSHNNLPPQFVRSMLNLNFLMETGLITKTEVGNIVQNAYLPNLKALSYTLDENKQSIGIFSHAPIGLETIKSICYKFSIKYQDQSIKDLANTIDAINDIFQNNYVKRKKITQLLESETNDRPGRIDANQSPFKHLIWNRNYANLTRPNKHNGYTIRYIHGHDSREKNVPGHIYNLDNNLGKGDDTLASYNIHYTHEKSSRQLKLGAQTSSSNARQKCTNHDQLSRNSVSFFKVSLFTALTLGCFAIGSAWYLGITQFFMIGCLTTTVTFGLLATINSPNGLLNSPASDSSFSRGPNVEQKIAGLHQKSSNNQFGNTQSKTNPLVFSKPQSKTNQHGTLHSNVPPTLSNRRIFKS